MHVVVVNLQIRSGWLAEFTDGIHANALASLRDELGCLRFDVHQHADDPHRFLLYEIYTSKEAFEVDHRQAPHYVAWRQVTAACVVPGSQVNTYCIPAFPQDIPEIACTAGPLAEGGRE